MKSQKPQIVTIKPVYLDRVLVHCPECGAGGMWATPEGFRVAISQYLLATCPNGHQWAISGAYAEQKYGD